MGRWGSEAMKNGRYREMLPLITIFVLGEMVWYQIGIRFDTFDPVTSPLKNYVQYVDPELLANHFTETVWNLHVQPPLFSIFLGLVLQFPETWHNPLFSLSYTSMALGLILVFRAILESWGVSRPGRLGACIFLSVSPPLVLLSKWLYIQMPVAFLLVLATYCLHNTLCRPSPKSYLLYGSCISAISLITGYFHFFWLCAMLIFPRVVRIGQQPSDMLASQTTSWMVSCIPAGLIPLLSLKNWFLFGVFAVSTWSNVAPSRTARDCIPETTMERLISQGTLSPYIRTDIEQVAIDSFRSPDTGIPVLDQKRLSSGKRNYNYQPLIEVYRHLGRDAFTIAKHYPTFWVRHALRAFVYFQAPATWSEYAVGENREKILTWSRFFEYAVWGQGLGYLLHQLLGMFGWLSLPTILIPLFTILGIVDFGRSYVKAGHPDPGSLSRLFVLSNIIYVALVAILIADNEYERYHFFSDALLFLMSCYWLVRMCIQKTIRD